MKTIKFLLCLIVLVNFSIKLSAQDEPKFDPNKAAAKAKLETTFSSESGFIPVSSGKVAMLNEIKGEYEITLYDKNLTKYWQTKLKNINKGFEFKMSLKDDNYIYLMFYPKAPQYPLYDIFQYNGNLKEQFNQTKEIQIFQIDLNNNKVNVLNAEFGSLMFFKEFETCENGVILMGRHFATKMGVSKKQIVTVALFDFKKKKVDFRDLKMYENNKITLIGGDVSDGKFGCAFVEIKEKGKNFVRGICFDRNNIENISETFDLDIPVTEQNWNYTISTNQNGNKILIARYFTEGIWYKYVYIAEIKKGGLAWEKKFEMAELEGKSFNNVMEKMTTGTNGSAGKSNSSASTLVEFGECVESDNAYIISLCRLIIKEGNGKREYSAKDIVFCLDKRGSKKWATTIEVPNFKYQKNHMNTFFQMVPVEDELLVIVNRKNPIAVYSISETGDVEEEEFLEGKRKANARIVSYGEVPWYGEYYLKIDWIYKNESDTKNASKKSNDIDLRSYDVYKFIPPLDQRPAEEEAEK